MTAVTSKEDLPNSWRWETLRNLGEWSGGGTPSKSNPEYWNQGDIPWVSPKDMKVQNIGASQDYISKAALVNTNLRLAPKGSLLMVTRSGILAHSFPVAINDVPVTVNQDLKVLVLSQNLTEQYIFYALKRYEMAILKECSKHGTTVHSIEMPKLMRFPLPIAPPEQQKRIVAKIEELFSHIDAGIEALRKTKQLLKQYRQSVLKAAVTGELTKEWREANKDKLQSSDELLATIKNKAEEIFPDQVAEWENDVKKWEHGSEGKKPSKPKKSPESVVLTEEDLKGEPILNSYWCRVRLNDLCHVVRGGSPRPAGHPKYFGGDIPWITVAELTKDDNMYLASVSKYVTPLGKDKSRYIKPNTLLLTNSGATLGVPTITNIHGCINDGSVALLGLNKTLKEYLYWFLRTKTEELRNINQGAAQPNLNTAIVRKIVVSIGCEEELAMINQLISDKLEKIDRLEYEVEKQLVKVEKSKQSVLVSAFVGKLK